MIHDTHEISDILTDSSLVDEPVRIECARVIAYDRGDLPDEGFPDYTATISQSNATLPIRGTEKEIGDDIPFRHSLQFRYSLVLTGVIRQEGSGDAYLQVDSVEFLE